MFVKGGWLNIHVENYCENPPDLHGGLPDTTKQDKRSHGFGLKSMRYIVEKYSGTFTVRVKGKLFCVGALIPVRE